MAWLSIHRQAAFAVAFSGAPLRRPSGFAGLYQRVTEEGTRNGGMRPNRPPIAAVILRGWHPRSISVARRWAVWGSALTTGFDIVAEWRERSLSRRQLLSFDDRALHDIGIDRATAQWEGERPFWRR